jgi:hypothetical protein
MAMSTRAQKRINPFGVGLCFYLSGNQKKKKREQQSSTHLYLFNKRVLTRKPGAYILNTFIEEK